MIRSFSLPSKVQVEYNIMPPGFSIRAAWRMMFFWMLLKNSGPCSSQAFTIFLSLRNIPSPEQGASISILSKYSGKYCSSLPGSSLSTSILPIPKTSMFLRSPLALELLISLATSIPCPFSLAPSSVALPPGAAHTSSTLSPGSTGRRLAGVIALGSCR